MDECGRVDMGQLPPSSSLGQFSFAPVTRTTVVTTTTTTTTNFPPLLVKPPRAIKDLDPKLYPLAASSTPESLRNFKFELGGRSVVFNEPEDAAGALKEFDAKNDILRAANGTIRSVSSFTSDESNRPRRPGPHGLSSQSSNNSSKSKMRPVSPVSIPDAGQASQRTRLARDLAASLPRSHHGGHTTTHPMASGLTTPEADSSSFIPGGNVLPKRRVHSSIIPRRETLLRSPLSFELETHETTQSSRSSSAGERLDVKCPSPEKLALRERSTQETEADVKEEDILESIPTSQATGDVSVVPSRQIPVSLSAQLPAIDSAVSQDMCLPSPSLSPVAAMNALNADSSFDSAEDPDGDTDSSFDQGVSQFPRPLQFEKPRKANAGSVPMSSGTSRPSLRDIPAMVDLFDSVPEELKSYLMYQFLKRCSKPTLHFVADLVNPALKCDFLDRLPLELSLNIVKHFDSKTMCRAAQVSKKWRHIVNSDEKTWKRLFESDGFVLQEGELERSIKEGWGWQFPDCDQYFDKDLSSQSSKAPSSSGLAAQATDTPSLPNRRSNKRKAATRTSSRKLAKKKTSSSPNDSNPEPPDWRSHIAAAEGPYAAANAAAAAVPYPDVGLPSLRGLHLYKSLYQRHHSIRQSWMDPNIEPKHIAFRAHDRHVVTCLQFDTDKILTGSDDTNINVYDTKTGALRTTLEGHEGGVWALEYHGNTLVSGSTDRSVRVWDIEKAKCTQVFHGHTSTVRCLQIVMPVEVGQSADGSPIMMPKEPLIITGSRDSNLRVWKLPKPDDPPFFPAPNHFDDSDCPYYIRTLTGHQHSVRAIAAHGDTLVSGSYDSTVRVWKISTGEILHRLQGHNMKVYSVVLDHKRKRCISGSMDNMVKIWSIETGSLLYNLEGHTSLVGLLDLQCDRLVSAAADSTLRIWDPENGQCKSTLSAHTGAITCFQHDGQKVISGSDRTLKMWNVQTGECVRDLLTDLSGVWQVKFNDRRCVAAVQRDHVTYIEVLDFGAFRDGVPTNRLGRRILVDERGHEAGVSDHDMSDA
ncbi:SCF ubiquitin ligase complex subunit cdc4 [Monascus purpureus]|uniref:Probable E3 ubiquitin ligase complex SCF subunit sconB n=1 Tax=Monascus purpureus TaxID=5098 RepID=A0A507R1J3_MONPU|nr:SCF ubiquitin ligase complex subunit cdc4 [Monascus purpureus]BDD55662.1 hypothetical protein MAP00_001154 [Monascus purpureus]